ncbi:hypothetical protein PR048_028842 [Dryococelus australis]|uniref:Uncharacterized protein n=1 Tax=Dryococelus australis TaxID=614101 RepID=A0ABQ9GEF4_9NEOP|nr:hypothetical protein PR048_028842 [Dryococelus australis]
MPDIRSYFPRDRSTWDRSHWRKIRAINANRARQRAGKKQLPPRRDISPPNERDLAEAGPSNRPDPVPAPAVKRTQPPRAAKKIPRIEEEEPISPIMPNDEVDAILQDVGLDEEGLMDVQNEGAGGRPERAAGGGGSAGGVPGGAGGGMCDKFRTPRLPPAHIEIEHEHLFILWANAWLYKKDASLGDDSQLLATSLAYFPVELLPFWLTSNEFYSLMPNATVKKLELVLIPVGEQTSFNTGSQVVQ